jgi:hypothetical protein
MRVLKALAVAGVVGVVPLTMPFAQTSARPTFVIDCEAFKKLGPNAFAVTKNTTIVQVEANNRFGYRAGQVMTPRGIKTSGVDLYDAVADRCTSI